MLDLVVGRRTLLVNQIVRAAQGTTYGDIKRAGLHLYVGRGVGTHLLSATDCPPVEWLFRNILSITRRNAVDQQNYFLLTNTTVLHCTYTTL